MPFRVGDAAAVQPMQCEMTAPGGAAKRGCATVSIRIVRMLQCKFSADASSYDRTPRVSLRSASVVGFYADRPAKKRRPPPVKTRSILIRSPHLNRGGTSAKNDCCDAIERRSTANKPRGKLLRRCCSNAAASASSGQPMCRPPLREKSAPVEKPDSSDASHAQIEAISVGSPRRLTGIVATILSSTS